MSTYSKRIKINPDVLLEYTFDDTNFRSEDYQVLTNLKEKTKSYLSDSTLNNQANSLFLVDPILSKYSTVDVNSFNFLKLQDFFTAAILNDKMKLYFPSGFDFAAVGYLGFYVNVYTYGYEDDTKYSLSNFYYVITNVDTIKIFDLPNPFYFDEKYWVKAIELEFPSVHSVSNDRIISGLLNVPKPDTINQNLTYGEGISTNDPIFIDFAYISSSNIVLGVPYYYTGDLYSASLPQVPEFTDIGITIQESTQGDYFEIFGTYMGSNENMDEFEYKQESIGVQIELQYIVSLYEENILTSNQTYVISKDNVTQKILYRPIIQFSNTTAAIDVELRIVNLVDNSYISKYGSLGITNSINKYGLRLTRLNMETGVVNAEIFNVKIKNTMTGGAADSFIDVMKVPYPVMVDRYRILTKTTNASTLTNDYVPNGLLEILITSFDNVIEFNIAQDINSKGEPIPYNLSTLSTNSNLKLVFKSDSEKLEKDPFFEADNNYEIGNISFKISEKDYKVLRRIYDKGYDNFYLVVAADNSTTQLYSGKFLFYEDVTFINGTTTGATSTTQAVTDQVVVNTTNVDSVDTSVDQNITQNNPFVQSNMSGYTEDPNVDKNYSNLLIYVRFQTNIDKMDAYLKTLGITPEIKYGNMYFLKRIYATTVVDIKSQDFIEKVFVISLTIGTASQSVTSYTDTNTNLRVFVNPPVDPTKPTTKPYTPPTPSIHT